MFREKTTADSLVAAVYDPIAGLGCTQSLFIPAIVVLPSVTVAKV